MTSIIQNKGCKPFDIVIRSINYKANKCVTGCIIDISFCLSSAVYSLPNIWYFHHVSAIQVKILLQNQLIVCSNFLVLGRISFLVMFVWYCQSIFLSQITTSLMEPPGLKNHTLMLADTESEKTKWVVALSELHRILKRNNLHNRTVSTLTYFCWTHIWLFYCGTPIHCSVI